LSLYLLHRLCYILPGTRQTPLRPSEAGNPTLAADPRGCLWITWTLSAVVLENAAAWIAAGNKALLSHLQTVYEQLGVSEAGSHRRSQLDKFCRVARDIELLC